MSRRSRFREHLPLAPKPEPYFRWRGSETSRLEGFADTVFAFAVTLLIVALEVPHTFEDLKDILRDFPAFVVCFAILMSFWNSHYRFFRRYALEDRPTRLLNYAILLSVLFSVYPLKFLFSSWLGSMFGGRHYRAYEYIDQLYVLYMIYGLGFAGINLLFGLLYGRAWRLRETLRLTAVESVLTRSAMWEHRLLIVVCFISVTLALLRTPPYMPGLAYLLIGVAFAVNGRHHSLQVRMLTAREAVTAAAPTA